jgi:Flp pilus assembly protein TadG
MAVLVPIALVLLLTIVQGGLWWHARNLCAAAAQEGVDAGRIVGATTTEARSAATSFLARAGSGLVTDPVITASVDATTARVQVSATVLRILPIPGLDVTAAQSRQAPKERFTTDLAGGRP